MLLSTNFRAKCHFVFALTKKNTSILKRLVLQPSERSWVPLKDSTEDF